MFQLDSSLEIIPLHRLLERRETIALLEEFLALMTGVELALIDAKGHIFVSTGGWTTTPTELAELLAHANDDQTFNTVDFFLQPLLVKSHLLGAVVGRGSIPENILRCLHYSLTMILVQALEKRDVARETLERYREINLLYHIGETIGTCLNSADVLRLVLSEANRIIRADVSLALLPRADDKAELEIKTSFGPTIHIKILHQTAQELIKQVCTTGRPDILNPPVSASARFGAILCVPLKTQKRVLGVVLLGRLAGQSMFTASDEKLVTVLAHQAAIALENAWLHQQELEHQRLEEELSIGQQIQLSLLPESCPTIPGWEFAAVYQSARQVGGDFYDFFELPGKPRRLGMVIADVTGKGVAAALLMAFSRSIMSTEALSGRSPAAALKRANSLIIKDSRSKLLLSIFYATLEVDSGRLIFASGGHNWPLWLPADSGQIQELNVNGFVLGAFEDIELEEREISLAPGDLLVFCTDGVTEAMNAAGQMFGEERLRATVAAKANANAEQVLQAITKATQTFTGDTPQSDDFTLFVVKRIDGGS